MRFPGNLKPTKARILRLRVTVPADILRSGIEIAIDGVEIQVNFSREELDKSKKSRKRSRSGHVVSDTSEADRLPTTEDISQSFLKEEPLDERRELEAAFASQSAQFLEESQALSEASEEDAGFGTGLGFTLPGFLTSMLNGIADRLQVTISDVVFSLETDIAPEDSIAGASFESGYQISLKLRTDSVEIEGFTSPVTGTTPNTGIAAPAPSRPDKRRLRLGTLTASLESDTGFFLQLQKCPDIDSPVQSRRGKWHDRTPSNSSRAVSSATSSPKVSRSVVAESRLFPPESSVTDHPYVSSPSTSNDILPSTSYDDHVRFADASVDDLQSSQTSHPDSTQDSNLHRSARSVNEVLTSDEPQMAFGNESEDLLIFRSSAGLHDSDDEGNFMMEEPEASVHGMSGVSPSHSSIVVALAATAPALFGEPESMGSSTASRLISRSEPTAVPMTANSVDRLDRNALHRSDSAHQTGTSSRSVSRSSSSGRSLDEDLLESKLFTNEEADSMYMSAMSEIHSEEQGTEEREASSAEPPSDLPLQSTAPGPSAPQYNFSQFRDDQPIDDRGCETPRASSPSLTNTSHSQVVQSSQTDMLEEKLINGTTMISSKPHLSGPRISVPFLIVDEVSFWFPWIGKTISDADNAENPPPPLKASSHQSVHHNMPGAFSQYAERSQKLPQRPPSPHPRANQKSTSSGVEILDDGKPQKASSGDLPLEIEVKSIDAAIDLATGGVLLSVLQRLAGSFSDDGAEPRGNAEISTPDESPHSSTPRMSLTVSRLTLSLLECLIPRSLGASSLGVNTGPAINDSTALLRLDMHRISVAYNQQHPTESAQIDIEKLFFGFPGDHIISFDSDSPMLSSRRSLEEQQKSDISLTYRQDEMRVELLTRPVKVVFDMSKFDDRLSCFGGLSGILDLSSSITSNGTVQQPSRAPSKGVRFAGQPQPPSMDVLSSIKINARIEGVNFALDGRACGVSVQTSAVKVAIREQAARFVIAEIVLQGPHHPTYNKPPLHLQLTDSEIQFQLKPAEADLEQLVSLITPSRDKYEDDDDILLDTLLLQRSKGSLVKLKISNCAICVGDIDGVLQFQYLGDELSKLSNVTKYLPEDDRPGLLSMVDITDIYTEINLHDPIGKLRLHCRGSKGAHVGFPALLAGELGKISLSRNDQELFVGPCLNLRDEDTLPMVMARQIGDELEPKVKVKLYNLVLEYRVSILMALMGINGGATPEDLATTMAASVVNIRPEQLPLSLSRHLTDTCDTSRSSTAALHLDLLLRDCAIGLNPANSDERGLILLTDARVTANMSAKESLKLGLEIRKASALLIDDISRLDLSAPVQLRPKSPYQASPALTDLCRQGYASVASISSAEVVVRAADGANGNKLLSVEISDKLFVLEACADSLKTLASLGGGLAPPSPPSKKIAVPQPHVMPIEDLMASFSGEAFAKPEMEDDESSKSVQDADHLLEDLPANLDYVGSFYEPGPESAELGRQSPNSDASRSTVTISAEDLKPDPPFSHAPEDIFEFDSKIKTFVIIENYLDIASRRGTARGWNSKTSSYGILFESQIQDCPLRLKVNLGTVIVNMFDGYDWVKTREIIAKAVDDVQEKADRRRRQRQALSREEDEAESEVGDFLFQSIWIAVPPNREGADLRKQINRQIDDDLATETGTVTTATKTQIAGRPLLKRRRSRSLRLERGKKKMSVELKNFDANILVMPPSADETRLNVDIRVHDLDVFDHVPTSTWNKLATCQIDQQDRQIDKPQLHLEILGVKPLPDTPNLELVVKVKMLPVSLHVDQDTQDFATRFGSFSDDSEPKGGDSGPEFFIQRIEIESIPVTFDYKPKRLDYAGLRSGRTGELMNLMTLDGTNFVLRHVILHGIEGGDQLHKSLHSIWMGDILQNQLRGVLAGLAPIRPLVNVGTGIQNLIVVPMQEYRKDGRIMRSIQKGAVAFARTTTRELARLGARVAIGTQNILEGTEGLLAPPPSTQSGGINRGRGIDDDWDEDFGEGPSGSTEKRVVSNYANQPLNVITGVRAAYRGLEKDLMTARDAIIAIGAEVRDGDSARGVAGAIARHGPAVILRPAIGTTRAIGTALLGAGNMLDKDSRRKLEEVGFGILEAFWGSELTLWQKYKSY